MFLGDTESRSYGISRSYPPAVSRGNFSEKTHREETCADLVQAALFFGAAIFRESFFGLLGELPVLGM